MNGVDRETFLSAVRQALGRTATVPPTESAPAVDEAITRLAGPGDDLQKLFTQRAHEVGMHVHPTGRGQLTDRVMTLLHEAGAQSAAAALPRNAQLLEDLRQSDLKLYDWQQPGAFDGLFDVDAGITDVHAALAESGTLVCCDDSDHGRALSLVPQTHIAVLSASGILPDMIDYWRAVGDSPPGSISFITGPSKTADIEGQLVQGVHGPAQVHIVLVTD